MMIVTTSNWVHATCTCETLMLQNMDILMFDEVGYF
jgi:hypothetical protein